MTVHLHTPGRQRPLATAVKHQRLSTCWCLGLALQLALVSGASGGTYARTEPARPPAASTTAREAVEHRYAQLASGLDLRVLELPDLADKVCSGLCESASEEQLAELMSETAAYRASMHPDLGRLAARVAVSRLHELTDPSLLTTLRRMHRQMANGAPAPLVSEALMRDAEAMAPALEKALRHDRDFDLDYFGLRTLQRSYLTRSSDGAPIERPQHLLMRVALCVHGRDEAAVLEAYDLMSRGLYTHATPTLFNAGRPRQQLASCFLLTTREDSIAGIYDTLRQCALISRDAGGIGVSVSHVRASQSYIRSSGGVSAGLVPMLRVFDATARYVDQGGGKRKGAFAIYLEPWHADVFEFLELKKNHGKEEARARDLFYALWIPDLFMRRVEANGEWSLFCPDECPGLVDAHGGAFEELYTRYESEGRARRTVPAQQLWCKTLEGHACTCMHMHHACTHASCMHIHAHTHTHTHTHTRGFNILEGMHVHACTYAYAYTCTCRYKTLEGHACTCMHMYHACTCMHMHAMYHACTCTCRYKILEGQVETGTPYLLYKDAANAKSNQQHLGTTCASTLCMYVRVCACMVHLGDHLRLQPLHVCACMCMYGAPQRPSAPPTFAPTLTPTLTMTPNPHPNHDPQPPP